LKLALRRAEEAHHAGDLEEAKLAVREALEIDPYETSAKALQVVILKQVEEQERQYRLRQLFDNARDQITSRNLTAAFQTLKEAEQVDPTSVELYSLMKVVSAARDEQLRKSEMEKLTRDIEEALNREDYAAAVAIADEGLQRQPREQGLLKLKALAEKQQQRVQLKAYARDQFLAANGLLEAGRTSESLSTIENALRTIPGDTQLERLRDIVKDRLAADAAEERKRQLLGRAQEMAAAEKFDEAVRILESLRRDFPGTEEIEPLLERTRAAAKYTQMVAQALDRAQRLLSQGSTEQAVQFLEEKTLELSDARLFDLLERARRQREQFQSGLQGSIEEGKRILQTHGALEAARYLAAQPTRYREIAEFHTFAEVVSNRMAVEALDQELMGKTDPDSQVRLAEAALRANPNNEEIKKRLVTVRSRKEQIHAIAGNARTLEASRQYSEAAKELQPLRQLYPQYPSLETEIRRLEQLEEQRLSEGARRQLEQFQLALQRALEEGKRILQRHGASEATKYLGTQPSKYRETHEFRAFAEVVAKRAAWEALDRDLAGNPDADAQIRLAEAAVRQNPGNEEIGTRLAVLRSRKAQISAFAENARALEASRQYEEAAKELRQFRQLHPQYPNLESEIGRLERLEEQRRAEDAARQLEEFQLASQKAVEEGHRILQRLGASEAAKYLSAQPAKYREVPQYRAFAEVVANQLAGETLDLELSRNPDPDAQVRAVETALRANPGNEEIKKRLGSVRGRREQISAVTEKARMLEASQQYREAAKELQQLRQLHPQYPNLESEIRRLERIEEQRLSEAARREAEQFQLAVRSVIEEGQRILQKRGASETAKYLGVQPAKYQETPEFRAFAVVIAKRVAWETLDQELAANTDPDTQVRAAEAALRANPANEEIKKRLAAVRSRREQVNTIVEKVRALEGSRRYGKAAKELQKMRTLYPQYPSLEPEIQRLEGLEEQSKQPQRVVETAKTKVDRPSVDHRQEELGATVIMGRPTTGRPTMGRPTEEPPAAREVQPGERSHEIAEPEVSQVSPRAQLSSKTWLIVAAVAIVVIAGVALVYVLNSRPTTVLVKVTPTPQDSTVSVDGVSCPVPCQLPLSPGKHVVAAEHVGYTAVTQDIQVPRGGSHNYSLTLPPIDKPIDNHTGEGGGNTGGSVAHDQGKGAKGGKVQAQGHNSGSGLSTTTGPNDTKASTGTQSLGPNSGGSPPSVAEVVIRNLPAAARVQVDGGDAHQADGSGLARFSVPVGNHSLDITADGYTSKRIQQTFSAGGPALDVSLDLDPEQQEWARLESSTDSGALQAFLRKYPAGKHAELAKDKLDKLTSSKGSGSAGTVSKNNGNLTDSGMISDTLGQLGRAYSDKNVGEVCGIWPGCPRKDFEKEFKDALAISMKFQPSAPPEISGELASVVCSRSRVTTYKGIPPRTWNDTVTIHLRKQNGKWRIDSIN
jgi:hypothetical protein